MKHGCMLTDLWGRFSWQLFMSGNSRKKHLLALIRFMVSLSFQVNFKFFSPLTFLRINSCFITEGVRKQDRHLNTVKFFNLNEIVSSTKWSVYCIVASKCSYNLPITWCISFINIKICLQLKINFFCCICDLEDLEGRCRD